MSTSVNNLSVFQLLPTHVVKLIVNYVAGGGRLQFDGVDPADNEYKLLQMPLLWVCHNFRAFVHQRFCQNYRLSLMNDSDRAEARLSSWPECHRGLGYPTHHLTKELELRLNIKYVYTGKALQLQSDAPYEGCSFPLVRKIVFYLTVEDDYGSETDSDDVCPRDIVYPPDTAANITAFAQRVKQMAPTIGEMSVTSDGFVEHLVRFRGDHTLDLVRQLFGIVENHTVITGIDDPLFMYTDLGQFCELVHIHYEDRYSYVDIIPLISRCARTLQFLYLGAYDTEVTGLIRDLDSGDYLQFPSMHTLSLSIFDDGAASKMAIPKDIVPFPRLERLISTLCFPFDNDVLFRGNAATLKCLGLRLYPETVSMLRTYRVFTPTSHPNLKCVAASLFTRDELITFDTVAEHMQFALSIAPGAPVRVISGLSNHSEAPTPALSMLKNHGCIQVLSLPDTPLSLWKTLSLVKSLPLLSDLESLLLIDGEPPQGVSIAMLPSYVRATYAPMGKRFRYWHIHVYSNGEVNCVELAGFILLMALACPNFDYAAVYESNREPFMKAIREMIDEPGFSQDAPRLRRLLINCR